MKKMVILVLLILLISISVFAGGMILRTGGLEVPFFITQFDEENRCYNISFSEITDSHHVVFDSLFNEMGVRNEPFAHLVYFIQMFHRATQDTVAGCVSLDDILTDGKSNLKSNVLATCALMRSSGWDVLCFYNNSECYLGINLEEKWQVRKGNWVEKDGKKYYLKEFDLVTPVGSLRTTDPAASYISIPSNSGDLQTIPPVRSLPSFSGDILVKKLVWYYRDSLYEVLSMIPEEQVRWTRNLPPSLYGMALSGIIEIQNAGLSERLQAVIDNMPEYDGVNCLYKLCQSKNIFIYDNSQPIKSVSQQIIDGRNDCDGRSVVLYALLSAIMEYSADEVVFLSWPNHIALGVKPKTSKALQWLISRDACFIGEYAVLDAAYSGNTQWGDKMERLADTCEIIR